MVVRQICSTVNEQFQLLLAQEEAKQRYHQSQLEQQQQQQVKPKMLKRMSASEKNDKQSRAASRKASHHTEQSDISSSRLISVQSTLSPPQPMLEPFSFTQESDPATNPGTEQLLDEIGQQFLSVTKEPSRRRTAAQVHGPKLKRLSSGVQEPVGKIAHLKQSPTRYDSEESVGEMVSPLRISHIEKHDGNIVSQDLQSTEGVKVPDDYDLFVTRSKTRMSILDFDQNPPFEPPQDGPSDIVVPPEVGFQNPIETISTEESPQHNVLRTSLILETMEDGEVETRIDGDGTATVLVQSFMGEKETAIVSKDGHTMLLPASELSKYEQENETSHTQQGVFETPSNVNDSSSVLPPSNLPSSPSPPQSPLSPVQPPMHAQPSPPPPPAQPIKKDRKPWPGKI